MNRNRLGTSGIVVSDLCLGTMTFGSTCDEATAHKIMDRAFEAGIDFFDTAELYPVPPKAEWVFQTEEIVGRWLKNKPRHSLSFWPPKSLALDTPGLSHLSAKEKRHWTAITFEPQ